MEKKNIFDLLRNAVEKVQKDNHDDPDQKTAPAKLFDRIKNGIDESKEKRVENKKDKKGLFDIFRERFSKERDDNEQDPEEETAEPTVFEQLQAELERLQNEQSAGKQYGPEEEPVTYGPMEEPVAPEPQVTHQPNYRPVEPIPTQQIEQIPIPDPEPLPSSNKPRTVNMGMAKVKSTGSIAVRIKPDMNAAQLPQRIPGSSDLRVLDHTMDNAINLDGKLTGWCLVDFHGMQGWVLDSYVAKG